MSPLPPAAEKPRFVAAMFGRIADRYDLMNALMTAGQDAAWRRAVADSLSTRHAARSTPLLALDVGTGTGKLAAAVAAGGACVVGVDFAWPMLRVARRRAGRTLAGALAVAAGDGLRLPFADATFDAVVSAFVVRNLADAAAGLAEQVRVLRPGGRLAILETTPAPPGWLRPLFRLYFRRLVPLLGGLIAGDRAAYTYLPESTAAFAEPERLAAHLRALGLTDINVRRLGFGSVALTTARRA